MTGMATRARSSRVRELLLRFIRLLCASFFRRVEVVGLGNVPNDRGGVLVAWHPNGMVDPGMILATFPGPVVFGARHGAFRFPVLGWLMRAIGTVPIFRAGDTRDLSPEERQRANMGSLDALAERVAGGWFSCLFPEGESHDEPHPLDLKTGASRLYYRACQLCDPAAPPPVIIPVGLHYDAKREFRSNVLVVFHPPIEIPAELDVLPAEDGDAEAAKERCHALTELIDGELEEVVLATESWETHHLMTYWGHRQVHMAFPTLPDAPVLAGLFVVALGAVGGVVALRYQRLALETARALRVRLTRARRRATLAHLRAERARLCDQVLALAEGLDLPGSIGDDGRIGMDGWVESGAPSGG